MYRTARMTPPTLRFMTEPAGGEGGGGAGSPAGQQEKTFTQDELNRVAAREKDQGKRVGLSEFATNLGFTKPDEVEAFIKAARDKEQQGLTEAEKKISEATAKETALAAREAAIAAKEAEVARKGVLIGLGASGVDLEDAIALLRVADDATDDDVKAAAEALKTRRPELFGAAGATAQDSGTQAPAPAPAGRPAGTQAPQGRQGAQKAGALGAAYAERRFGKKAEASA